MSQATTTLMHASFGQGLTINAIFAGMTLSNINQPQSVLNAVLYLGLGIYPISCALVTNAKLILV